MPRCRKHNHPDRKTCDGCHVVQVTQDEVIDSLRAEEERKVALATRLALFLGTNDVENYVSPKGYRMKIITIRKVGEATAAPWCQSSRTEAA